LSSVFIYYFQDVAQEAVRAETVTKRTFTANSIFGGCKIQGCQELVVITNKIKVAAFCLKFSFVQGGDEDVFSFRSSFLHFISYLRAFHYFYVLWSFFIGPISLL